DREPRDDGHEVRADPQHQQREEVRDGEQALDEDEQSAELLRVLDVHLHRVAADPLRRLRGVRVHPGSGTVARSARTRTVARTAGPRAVAGTAGAGAVAGSARTGRRPVAGAALAAGRRAVPRTA